MSKGMDLTTASMGWALLGAMSLGCGGATQEPTDTSTNWLASCEEDADCGGSLVCLCNTCTVECTSDDQCSAGPRLECAPPTASCEHSFNSCQPVTASPAENESPSAPAAPVTTRGWASALDSYTYANETYHAVTVAGAEVWVMGWPRSPGTPSPSGPDTGLLACSRDYNSGVTLRRGESDGFAATKHPIASTTLAMHGSDENNIWAVGRLETVAQFDGQQWQAHNEAVAALAGVDPDNACQEVSLTSVFTLSAKDTWVAGHFAAGENRGGLVLHFDGETWQAETTAAGNSLNSVWASARNDVWAGGSSGSMYHYDGVSWTQVDSSTTNYITEIVGVSRDNVWALAGGLLHFDGETWSVVAGAARDPNELGTIAIAPDGELWATRNGTRDGVLSQTLSRLNGDHWIDTETTTDSSAFVSRIAVTDSGEVWAVGDGITRFR